MQRFFLAAVLLASVLACAQPASADCAADHVQDCQTAPAPASQSAGAWSLPANPSAQDRPLKDKAPVGFGWG